MNKQVIGICGFISAGKDTAADYLVDIHKFRQDSFAAPLKDAISAVFGWDRAMIEGRTAEARAERETVDTWWAERLGMPTLTPRLAMQLWGTEVCRRGFHSDIWIASLESRLRNTSDNIVISDCRFPNEINAVKQAGGKLLWIQRGELPSWHIMAGKANNGDPVAAEKLKCLGIHASETAWVGSKFDAIIDNNGTLLELYGQIASIVQ